MYTFVGESDLEVNHKDSNKRNNSINNLEYVTRQENENHCRLYGNKQKFHKPFIVIFNNGNIKEYATKKQLSTEIGVTKTSVQQWLHGETNGYRNHGIKEIKYK